MTPMPISTSGWLQAVLVAGPWALCGCSQGAATDPLGSVGGATGSVAVQSDGGVSGSSSAGVAGGAAVMSPVGGSTGVNGVGGSATTGGAGGGPAHDACPVNANYALCDDFEEPTIRSLWKVQHSQANDVQLSEDAKSGQQALHLIMKAEQGGGSAHVTAQLPAALERHYFGRAYYRIDTLPSENVHTNYLTGRGPLPSGGPVANYSYGLGGHQFMANYFVFDPWQDWWKNSDVTMPAGSWLCLEWEFDAGTDTMRQWLDGQALADQTVVAESPCCAGKPWAAPSFREQMLGWDYYQDNSTEQWNVWIDAVALDTQRIGCLTD